MDEPIPTGHGIGNEPQLRKRSLQPDPTEERAANTLASEERGDDPAGHMADQSVHDEAHTLYTTTGVTEGGWATWFAQKRASVSALQSWSVVLLCALVSGPLAVIGTFLAREEWYLAMVFYGPAIEEVLKIGLLAILVETRPYLLRGTTQIRLIAYTSALSFATVENLLYIHVYLDDPTPSLILWRWSVCTGLHFIATAIAVEGLVRTWGRSLATGMRPTLDGAYRWLFIAIGVHAAYNLTVMLMEMSGYAF